MIPTSWRLFQCYFFHISVWLFSILIVLSKISYVSIIARLLPYQYTHPDPSNKIVFLGCCFEHASSLYPPHHQLLSSLTVLFHSFPWHHLSYAVKTSVPAPAGLPPTLSPTITRLFRFVTSTYVLFVLEEAPHSHPKCFFLILDNFLSNLFCSDTFNQLRTGKWLGYGQKRVLPVALTNTFELLTWIYIFFYV